MRIAAAALLTAALASTACRGDAKKCEQAARNYATLVYWKKANAELDRLPPERREGERKKKLSAFTNELEGAIDGIVAQCQSANNDEQIDCMIAAKTAEAAQKCADLAE